MVVNKKRYLKVVESISSPTLFLKYLFCKLIVDAHEGGDMDTFEVPGAYLYE